MKKLLTLLFFTLFLGVNAFAQQSFTLVSSEKKTIKQIDLNRLESAQTRGVKENSNLKFTENEIDLVITTGPADDMLSYRVQGVRNPNLIVPAGAALKILFVNTDTDMRHDVRFGHARENFDLAPEIAQTAGSEKLSASAEGDIFQAEEIVVKSTETGKFKYFCSVRGHARGGMWGNIVVGEVSAENLKIAPKEKHVHAPGEEDADHGHDKKAADKKTGGAPDANHARDKTDEKSGANQNHGDKKTDANHAHDAKKTAANHAVGGHDEMKMSAATDIASPMTREGSGTAWLPDSSPLHAYMKMFGDGGMLMAHGNMFVRYKQVGSTRDVSAAGKGGRTRFDAPSMFMLMYSRPLTEKSQLGFRAMMSLDPVIERGYGYPILYQSGELYRGEPIHDRQHPHDFFSELAVSYSYKTGENQSVFFYAGLPGEPAVGAPAFMHRASAANNPDAPISHHWQDATHITWGVVTAGYNFGKFKFEASAFKGEEPDENRWNFDKPRLDSFSGRFSWNPTKNLALQISHAYLKNPEPHEPDIRIMRRTTASAIYNKKIDENTNWASSFVWGQNYANGERTNAFLFESSYDFGKNSVFGRLEQVQKSGHELVLDHDLGEDLEHGVFRVGAYSLGYLRELTKGKGIDVGLGGSVTLNTNPSALTPVYGGTKHGGWQVFLRFRPSATKH